MSTPRSATQESFDLLRRDPFFDVVVDLTAGYLASAFGEPAAHETTGWTLACLPSGSSPDHERLFTLRVGPVEVLHIDRYTEGGETVDYRTVLATSTSALVRHTGSSLDELSMRYPLLKFVELDHPSAGGDGVAVDWFLSDEGADDQFFMLPLDETTIGPLADRLVDANVGSPAREHNPWFARYVLEKMDED